MSRPLKFRVWDGKRMSYPKTVEIGINGINGLTSASYQLDDGGYCTSAYVMQFTGRLDKQGKEIYEGDVMEWEPVKNRPRLGVVNYDEVSASWHLDPLCTWIPDGVVIGNIYENPELRQSNQDA